MITTTAATQTQSLAQARARVYRLQRALVLGVGDDAALDAAIVAYRALRARAACPSAAGPPDSAAEARLAGWLVEALRQSGGVAAA
jgi:hypothetical protein